MRILFISDVAYPWVKGGSEFREFRVAQYLERNGHKVDFLCGKWWKGNRRSGNHMGLKMITRLYRGKRSVLSAVTFTGSLFLTLPRISEKYDLIEINQSPMLDFALIDIIKRASFASEAVLVGAMHEIWQEYWIDYAGLFAGSLGYLLEHHALTKLDHIITISEFNKTKLARWKITPEKISVIRPGVDYDFIENIMPSDSISDVIFVGRLVFEKRVDLLIKATKVLKENYGRHDIRVLVVGGGPEEQNLLALTRSLELAGKVKFVGRLSRNEDVYALMKASKVFVYPGAPEGGWAIALIEANSAGLPAISSDKSEIGVANEVIRESENGFIVRDLTAEGLAASIDLLLSDEKLRKGLSAKARLFAKQFDWKLISKETEALYNSLSSSFKGRN